jgi:hypothetical protein
VGQGERQRGVDRAGREDGAAEHVAAVEEHVVVAEPALRLLVHALLVQMPGDLDADEVALAQGRLAVGQFQDGAGAAADVDDPARAYVLADGGPLAGRAVGEGLDVGPVVTGCGQPALVADHRVVDHRAHALRQPVPVKDVHSGRMG